MYKIQTNLSGTRNIMVDDSHLATIRRYHLLDNLVDSNGIVNEPVLDKLKFTVRSMLSGDAGGDKALLDLCLDIIYHSNMKALGLSNLIALYQEWVKNQAEKEEETDAENTQP